MISNSEGTISIPIAVSIYTDSVTSLSLALTPTLTPTRGPTLRMTAYKLICGGGQGRAFLDLRLEEWVDMWGCMWVGWGNK